MKIYNKIRIDIKTGKTLEEDSFEYEGPIAHCFGDGGSSVEYTQSPEQAEMYAAIQPVVSKMAGAATRSGSTGAFLPYSTSPSPVGGAPVRSYGGKGGKGGWSPSARSNLSRLYSIPTAPAAPIMPSMQDIPMYDVPDASLMMPTQNWWNSLSPEVMQGLWSPYNAGANQMMETMGAGGNLGSARGGYAGTGENALGRFYADASNDVGLQAWQMTQPAAMANWGAQLDVNKTGYNQAVQDYTNTSNQLMSDYGMNQEMWRQQIAREQMPFGVLPGMVGGTYSTPVVNQGGMNPWASAGLMGVGGGLMANSGMLGAAAATGFNPLAIGAGLGAMALGGGK